MADERTRVPAEVFPPGEFIKEEIEERGWSQADLAAILGRPLQMVNELIAGKRGVTPETAQGLAEAFGTGAEFWMNLESAYQLWRAKRPDENIARRAKIYSKGPIKEMVRRGWIDDSRNIDVLERQVVEFFELKSIDDTPKFPCAARKGTSYDEPATPAQCAWLFRARQLARDLRVQPFTPARLNTAITQLRQLMGDADAVAQVPVVLSGAGVRFVIVEALAHTRVDGATFWLNATSPVVALSIRYDRIDWFWFTLEHELGHVSHRDGFKGGTPTNPLLDVDLVGADKPGRADKLPEERRANEFAAAQIIPQDVFARFIAKVRPLYSKARIITFAAELDLHPALVVGQLQHRGEITYAHSREMLERVRHRITAAAPTDGWGQRPATPA